MAEKVCPVRGFLSDTFCACRLQIPGETRNEDAWLKGTSLKVGETLYDLIVNPPTLQKVSCLASVKLYECSSESC